MRSLMSFRMVLIVAACVVAPSVASAQSGIAGVVRDATGGVLPGVTVEVRSPAIIEGVRSAVTDASGQYRVVDLRPGTYTVTFTLTGFNGVRREGIVLEGNFTASVNAELRVGSIEETITVTGESPVVDVQNTLRREVVNRELLDALPTGRDFQTIGNVLPSVNMGRFDVAGSSTAQSGTLVAFGSRGGDFQLQIDGMAASITFGEGWFNGMYHNESVFQEMSYTVSGGSAETQTGGVTVNMIPRVGGNTFSFDGLGTYTNSSLQGQNVDDALLARRYQPTAGGLDKMWDANFSAGGPILRDRLWFFASGRHWGISENVGNVFWKDGTQASDDTRLKAGNVRLTTNLGNTRITGSYDNGPRWRRHFGIENRGGAPESFAQYPNESYVNQIKATTTLSSRMLLETGFTRVWWWSLLQAQPGTLLATCTVAFDACAPGTDYGDIRKQDLALGWNWNAPTNPESEFEAPRNTTLASLSYVTGAHNLKIGYTHAWGYRLITTPQNNGGLVQRYRNGVPDSVQLVVQPSVQHTRIDAEIAAYIQDSWTRGRLTLNPGLRLDYVNGSIADQTAPAGRFLPERRFTQADYVTIPTFTDLSPRFGVAYDLTGNGRTALKGSIGKYVQSFSSNLGDDYNPMGGLGDTRTWRDLNGDDIAQENELGPSTNLNFGRPLNVTRPDADLKRPYQMLYNASVQHELMRGLSTSLSYYYRRYYREFWINNVATTHGDYSPIAIADPRGNGETITVYSISQEKLGVIDNVRMNSGENGRDYHGVDLSFTGRLPNGTQLQGGVNTGKVHEYQCEVNDPNSLRYCDRSYPTQTQFKLSGTYPLPYGFRVSGLFQSVPGVQSARDAGNVGRDVNVTYSVGAAQAPGLRQTTVALRLGAPGEYMLDRVNQVDFAVSRDFRVGQVRLRPQMDVFNAFNNNAVTQINSTYGANLLVPQIVLNPRLVRFNVRVSF